MNGRELTRARAVAALNPDAWLGPRPWYVVIPPRATCELRGALVGAAAAPTMDRATVTARVWSQAAPGVFEIWRRTRTGGAVFEEAYESGQRVRSETREAIA